MIYFKNVEDNYISSIYAVDSDGEGNINKEEYDRLYEIFNNLFELEDPYNYHINASTFELEKYRDLNLDDFELSSDEIENALEAIL